MGRTPLLTEDFLLWQAELTEIPLPRVELWTTRWELAALITTWLVSVVALGLTVWLMSSLG